MKKALKPTRKYFRTIITASNREYIAEFENNFKSDIDAFAQSISEAYDAHYLLSQGMGSNKRRACVSSYMYKAVQDLVSAFHIFLLGYITPPGNLMRHFHESVAMAILLTHSDKEYARFEKDSKYRVDRAFDLIDKNPSLFKFNANSWSTFKKIKNVYHSSSHSTQFAISCLSVQSEKGLTVLGGYFDKGKIKHYKLELRRMISAAVCLENVITGISSVYKKL